MRFPTRDFVWSAIVLLSACGGKSDAPTPPTVTTVSSITMSPPQLSMLAGSTRQVSAVAQDQEGQAISGKAMTWSTSDASVATVATVAPTYPSVNITAIGPGIATITATAEGKSATLALTVTGLGECTAGNSVSMNVGEIRTLTSAEKSQICIAAPTGGAEYKLVLVNTGPPATVTLTPFNTLALPGGDQLNLPTSVANAHAGSGVSDFGYQSSLEGRSDADYMQRELNALNKQFPGGIPFAAKTAALRSAELPREGDREEFNINFNDASCSAASKLTTARVAKVGKHVILYADLDASDLLYTDQQFETLAATFDSLVYPMDTLNFGAPTDLDGNSRIKVLFTPAVYAAGAYGMVTYRDFMTRNFCPASNAGEITYLGTPDATRSDRAGTRESMFAFAPFLFAHELQHVINAGRRGAYVETSAMNEGLSYMAVELLFYRMSGLAPGSNLGTKFSSQAANDAFRWSGELFSFYFSFASRPDSNTALTSNASIPTYGALWYLLRFAADRKGGDQAATWRSLVNSTVSGTSNIAATFGNLPSLLRDWAVSQVVDDVVPGIPNSVQFPSWNYRSFNVQPAYPLREWDLTKTPVTVGLVNGGSAYFQFGVAGGTVGRIRANFLGSEVFVPDVMLVRSK